MIAAVRGVLAGGAFLLYVRHFAARRDLTVMARHAAAPKSGESEESNQTHHRRLPLIDIQQFLYRRARRFLAPSDRQHQIRDSRDLARSRSYGDRARRLPVMIWTHVEWKLVPH